jgi:hypothetical protein
MILNSKKKAHIQVLFLLDIYDILPKAQIHTIWPS